MKKTLWGSLIGVTLLAFFPLFLHLDTIPLFVFDEARLANNALEMAHHNHWIVTHYNGEPDLWNTKPPLMIWLQALSMKVLGFELLAVRLPAAIAGLATLLGVFVLVWRHTRSHLTSWGATLALLTTPGYITIHATRTGDYDALLTLWSTLFLLQFFLLLHSAEAREQTRRIWLAMAFFTLGVLTKGIVIFLFLPGLFLYTLLSRNLLPLLRQRQFYFSLLASVATVAIYYLEREWALPGYLAAVMENELGGRFLNVIESHEGPWYFYLLNLATDQFWPWFSLLPLAIAMVFADPEKARRPLWGFALLNALAFILILSLAQTKLFWYSVPALPLLAIAVGGSIGALLEKKHSPLLTALLMAGLFIAPYAIQIRQSYQLKDTYYGWEQRQYGPFMKDLRDWPGYTVVLTDYNAHILFYAQAYKAKGQDIHLLYPHELTPGDTVMICEDRARQAVLDRWSLEKELTVRKECGMYVLGKK